MINMSDDDRKRVSTILKMWNYFGPSPQNTGMEGGVSIDSFMTLSSEVGPYLPAIYPEMLEYFSGIFNKLYVRGKSRIAKDLNIDPRLIPDF